MAADSKTEKATPKKRRDERKEGNIFFSNDIVNVVCVFGGFIIFNLLFPGMYKNISGFMVRYVSVLGSVDELSLGRLQEIGLDFMVTAAKTVLPYMMICIVLAIISTGAQTKFLFTSKNFKPKFNRLSPLQGIKKLFSLKNVIELIKNILKIIVLIVIIYTLLEKDIVDVIRTMDMDVTVSAAYMLKLTMEMILKVAMVFVVVAGLDYLYQWWDYERRIKMSKQELKEEYKQTEGNPEIKGRIRDVQRQRAKSRMMQAVPEADVIIRNPTHFAVALKYDMDENIAPIVIAKGQDELALRIIRVGEENGVIVVENRPLARAIFAQSELGREIPMEYYGVVAEILVYVYKMNKKME